MLCIRLGISCYESHEQISVESRLGPLDYYKNISKYLRNTKDLFLIFGEGLELRVRGYTNVDGKISTSIYILEYVGSVCWKGFKQSINES